MSQGNPYYPKGGAGGGGFLSGGSPQGSVGGSPGGMGRREDAAQALRPVTIKQLAGATQAHADADWTIDNCAIGQITLVGQVMSSTQQATNTLYWIDDSTGRIEARKWVDSSTQDGDDKIVIENDTFVRVTGSLKMFGPKRYINATHIRPVQDYHETHFHLLEAMAVVVFHEKGMPTEAEQNHGLNSSQAGAYTSQTNASSRDQYASLPPIQREIVRFMQSQPHNPDGIHVGAIARAIVNSDANEINNAIDQLMDDGLVFSTMDDSHFNLSI